jgi:hypothetical protein
MPFQHFELFVSPESCRFTIFSSTILLLLPKSPSEVFFFSISAFLAQQALFEANAVDFPTSFSLCRRHHKPASAANACYVSHLFSSPTFFPQALSSLHQQPPSSFFPYSSPFWARLVASHRPFGPTFVAPNYLPPLQRPPFFFPLFFPRGTQQKFNLLPGPLSHLNRRRRTFFSTAQELSSDFTASSISYSITHFDHVQHRLAPFSDTLRVTTLRCIKFSFM